MQTLVMEPIPQEQISQHAPISENAVVVCGHDSGLLAYVNDARMGTALVAALNREFGKQDQFYTRPFSVSGDGDDYVESLYTGSLFRLIRNGRRIGLSFYVPEVTTLLYQIAF